MGKLHRYQENAVDHILIHPKCALFLEPGLGKTAICIEAMKYLPKPILIIAPKRVIQYVWPAEFKKWNSEYDFVSLSVGQDARKAAYLECKPVNLINFEIVNTVFDNYEWIYKTLIIDESTRVKNHATKIFKILKRLSNKCERVIELTGTPSPRGLEDLWSQIYLLDRGDRLGKTVTAFRNRWFKQGYCAWDRKPLPGAQDEIQGRILDLCLSMKSSDYIDLPPMITQDIVITLPSKAMVEYNILKKQMVADINNTEITALTAATLAMKLLQITSGVVYSSKKDLIKSNVVKLETLAELIEDLGDENLLIVYQFKSEMDGLRKMGIPEIRDNPGIINKWNERRIKAMAIHPASAGHGLNLQSGGSHICWTTPTYNLEYYQQTNARLHRQGQTKPVIIHRIIASGTIDEHVINCLEGKNSLQNTLMEALKDVYT